MTIIEQLEALQVEKATVEANLAAAIGNVSAKDEEITALKAQLDGLVNEKSGIEAKHAETLAAKDAELAEMKAAKEASDKQIEDFKRKLEDPAYKAASVDGVKEAVADGGAVAGEASKTLAQQMREIADPKERRAFYLANEKEIKAGL